MNPRGSILVLGVAAALGLTAGLATGQQVLTPAPEQQTPSQAPAQEAPKLAADAISDKRANGPLPVAPYAVPVVPCHYTGYYVGGGCLWSGSPPTVLQGTWGWDYEGHGWIVRRVWLKWCCRYQGGLGAYETTGPHVPDIFAVKLHHGPECTEP